MSLCGGCNVLAPWEHRCFGENSGCLCSECREADRLFGPTAPRLVNTKTNDEERISELRVELADWIGRVSVIRSTLSRAERDLEEAMEMIAERDRTIEELQQERFRLAAELAEKTIAEELRS